MINIKIPMEVKENETLFGSVKFGSPFYALRFLFKVEKEINQLRILLKSKFLKLEKSEIERLL